MVIRIGQEVMTMVVVGMKAVGPDSKGARASDHILTGEIIVEYRLVTTRSPPLGEVYGI